MIHQDLITKGNTDSPTPPATWTGAAKVDMSKDGWKDRIQEYATAEFLEANGMDADLAKTVASTTNAKIKAKKAKKEEKTKAIESTAQTALAVTALVVTGGAAAPALGSVLTGTAGGTFYAVQGANIALQAAIGSRTGGVQGAVAGVVNGTLQSLAATNLGALTKGSKELVGKAKEVQQIALDNPILIKALAATNVSYTKEDGWGIKANVSGVVQALGVRGGLNFERFTNVTIGQSQRGGASVNLGFNTGAGTLGVNYTGATGKFDGSFDIMERQAGTGNLSAELNYGQDGFSVSGNADLGNGLGFGLENGRNGTTGSLTILGSQQGTVDEDGNYEANSNFLGEISGQDIIDLNNTRQQQREAEENERNPVKSAKDAADAKDARDADAQEVGGEEGPSGLVDLAFAGLGVVMSAGAAFLAGGGSSSASPSAPAGGQSGAGNGANPTVARKPEDDDSPKKQPTKEELANFKDNIFLNTTRAATDAYLDKLDAQGVDTKEMRAHAEALRAKGVRDLTASEIQAKKLENQIGGDNQDPSKGLTSKELNEYLGIQNKLRANKDLTPAEQERHAYLGKIRNIQLYSDAVGQSGNGSNGKRDGKNEIENARKGEGLSKLADHLDPKKEQLKKKEEELRKNQKLFLDNSYYTKDDLDRLKEKIAGKKDAKGDYTGDSVFRQRTAKDSAMVLHLEDLKSKVQKEYDAYYKDKDKSKLTLITDPEKANIFIKSEMSDVVSKICNVNGLLLLLNELPIIPDNEKPTLSQFLARGMKPFGGITESVDNDEKPTGRLVSADPQPTLIPYLDNKGFKLEGFDIGKGKGEFTKEAVVQQFLESDQRIALLKDDDHMWGLIKVPIDENDLSKGFKAILYDPSNSSIYSGDLKSEREWNNRDSHQNPKRGYWVVPKNPIKP